MNNVEISYLNQCVFTTPSSYAYTSFGVVGVNLIVEYYFQVSVKGIWRAYIYFQKERKIWAGKDYFNRAICHELMISKYSWDNTYDLLVYKVFILSKISNRYQKSWEKIKCCIPFSNVENIEYHHQIKDNSPNSVTLLNRCVFGQRLHIQTLWLLNSPRPKSL